MQNFNEIYFGPPYWLTSDGGPQFSAANEAIQKWTEEAKISHQISSAYNPEGNGEAESEVKKIKLAIAHAGENLESLNSIVANLNTDQRTDGSGSAAELFLQRTLRVPGLAHIPTHLENTDKEKEARILAREKQVQRKQNQRRPDVFQINQKVVIQNNVSKLWIIKGKVIARCEHQGLLSNSYIIKVSRTGRHACWSEWHIRPLVTNDDAPSTDISNDRTANSISLSLPGIRTRLSMKQKLSFQRTLTGEKDSTRAEVGAALCLCTGSQASSPTPTKDNQPDRIIGGGKSVRFSPIIQIFEESGEEYFKKDFLRDMQKSLRPGFQNEVWDSKVWRLHKSTLTKYWVVSEDQERAQIRSRVCRDRCSSEPGSRRSLLLREVCSGPTDGGR